MAWRLEGRGRAPRPLPSFETRSFGSLLRMRAGLFRLTKTERHGMASRRTRAGTAPAAILRDAILRIAPQDEGRFVSADQDRAPWHGLSKDEGGHRARCHPSRRDPSDRSSG